MSYSKIQKLIKLFPKGIVVDGIDLLQVIDKQSSLLHEFRHMGNINPKNTSVRSTEIHKMITDCWK